MTITKTSQGYEFFEYVEKEDVVYKMHYIGYPKKECLKRFRAMKKEQRAIRKR